MDEHGNYGTRLRELRCDCRGCESEGRLDSGPDCLWYSPYHYALSQGADEDTAAEFHEDVREQGHRLGVIPPTKDAWRRFQAQSRRSS
jgi:hypothetical protein